MAYWLQAVLNHADGVLPDARLAYQWLLSAKALQLINTKQPSRVVLNCKVIHEFFANVWEGTVEEYMPFDDYGIYPITEAYAALFANCEETTVIARYVLKNDRAGLLDAYVVAMCP
jgi:hypothetical protein